MEASRPYLLNLFVVPYSIDASTPNLMHFVQFQTSSIDASHILPHTCKTVADVFHGCLLPSDVDGRETEIPRPPSRNGCSYQNAGEDLEARHFLL